MKIVEVDTIQRFYADLFAHLVDLGEVLELNDDFIGLYFIVLC